MKDIAALLQKIIDKAEDKDATYLYGVEYASDIEKPGFQCLVRFTKEGVPPVLMAAKSRQGLKKQLERYLETEEANKDVNVRYHEAKIEQEKLAITHHLRMIREYENPSGELPTE